MSRQLDIAIGTGDTLVKFEVSPSAFGGLRIDRCETDGDTLVVPDFLEGEAVVEFGASSFSRQPHIREIVCPRNVRAIANRAFSGCLGLRRLVLPDGIEHADRSWLASCSTLDELVLPASIPVVGADFFNSCPARRIIIGKLTSKVEAPHTELPHLAEIVIDPENPFLITDGAAIYDRSNLTLLSCPSCVVNYRVLDGCGAVGDKAFSNKESLRSIELADSVRSVGCRTFAGSGIEQFTAGNALEEIGESAFRRCLNLKKATLGPRIERIGVEAFHQCAQLTSLQLPDSLEEIGLNAFAQTALVPSGDEPTLVIAPENPHVRLASDGLLYRLGKRGATVLQALDDKLSECSIEAGTDAIEPRAFFGHPSLQQVTLPQGLTSIGESAFAECPHLTDLAVPDSLKTIGHEAFRATPLTRLDLPAGFAHLGNLALCPFRDEGGFIALRGSTPSPHCAVVVEAGNPSFFVEGGMLCERTTAASSSPDPNAGPDALGGSPSATGTTMATLDIAGGAAFDMTMPATLNNQAVVSHDSRMPESDAANPHISAAFDVVFCAGATLPVPNAGSPVPQSPETPGGSTGKRSVVARMYTGPDTQVAIPDEVSELGPYAFAGVAEVEWLRIPCSVTTFGEASLSFAEAPRTLELEVETSAGLRTVRLHPIAGPNGRRAIRHALSGTKLDRIKLVENSDVEAVKCKDLFERVRYELDRLEDPKLLSQEHESEFRDDLRRNIVPIAREFAKRNYSRGFDRLADQGVLTADSLPAVLDSIDTGSNVKAAASLLDLRMRRFDDMKGRYAL